MPLYFAISSGNPKLSTSQSKIHKKFKYGKEKYSTRQMIHLLESLPECEYYIHAKAKPDFIIVPDSNVKPDKSVYENNLVDINTPIITLGNFLKKMNNYKFKKAARRVSNIKKVVKRGIKKFKELAATKQDTIKQSERDRKDKKEKAKIAQKKKLEKKISTKKVDLKKTKGTTTTAKTKAQTRPVLSSKRKYRYEDDDDISEDEEEEEEEEEEAELTEDEEFDTDEEESDEEEEEESDDEEEESDEEEEEESDEDEDEGYRFYKIQKDIRKIEMPQSSVPDTQYSFDPKLESIKPHHKDIAAKALKLIYEDKMLMKRLFKIIADSIIIRYIVPNSEIKKSAKQLYSAMRNFKGIDMSEELNRINEALEFGDPILKRGGKEDIKFTQSFLNALLTLRQDNFINQTLYNAIANRMLEQLKSEDKDKALQLLEALENLPIRTPHWKRVQDYVKKYITK